MNASNSDLGNDETATKNRIESELVDGTGNEELQTEHKHNFVFEYWVSIKRVTSSDLDRQRFFFTNKSNRIAYSKRPFGISQTSWYF